MVVAVLMGVVMGIAHYFGTLFCAKCKPYGPKIMSFSAGIAVTYIFLELIPRFTTLVLSINKLLFLSVLIGFVIFHLVEKYIYRHFPKQKLIRELAFEDSVVSFVYHFIVGVMLVRFIGISLVEGLLFFIPVFFYTAVSTLPVDAPEKKWAQFLLSFSTLLGVLFAYLFTIPQTISVAMLGFMMGTIMYTVIRHSLPMDDEGQPVYFSIGVVLYAALIIFSWSL